MPDYLSRQIHLRRRPQGMPVAEDFEFVTIPLPKPAEGQVLVRNLYMSVDPYMRGRMRDVPSYTPPFPLGEVLTGGSVGRVVESNAASLQAGDSVLSFHGWRDMFVDDASNVRKIDASNVPIQAYLGAFGMPGRTAYVGLLDVAQLQDGETVFVSGAAGIVGSIACQIAKIKGCRVIGSAGSKRKVDWLTEEIGIDAAFNYKEVDNLKRALRDGAPDGIDVYFDNVGGDHLEAAISRMNQFGRVAACGSISQYNAEAPVPGPANLSLIVGKRITIRGFIVSDHSHLFRDFYRDMEAWHAAGQIKWEETIVEGLENAPQAFVGLFTGENLGKMLVQISPDPE